MGSELPTVAVVGEAMLELSQDAIGHTFLGYGGDTLNTSVYLARLGVQVEFISALGLDPYSDSLLEDWRTEGVGQTFVLRHEHRLPGLYAIRTDAKGERRFFYWRDQSAMRDFFGMDGHLEALAYAARADWLYLSGITLSLFGPEGREKLGQVAASVRAAGGQVVFDPNYRPRGWENAAEAANAFQAIASHVTIALPTLDDENMLHGTLNEEDHAKRWMEAGAGLVALKRGADGVSLYQNNSTPCHIRPEVPLAPLDTTGAGDSFNAAFISALLNGASPSQAAAAGNHLAGRVVMHRGAIMARTEMAGL